MRIDIDRINPAFKELIKHHDQVIFLDANILFLLTGAISKNI